MLFITHYQQLWNQRFDFGPLFYLSQVVVTAYENTLLKSVFSWLACIIEAPYSRLEDPTLVWIKVSYHWCFNIYMFFKMQFSLQIFYLGNVTHLSFIFTQHVNCVGASATRGETNGMNRVHTLLVPIQCSSLKINQITGFFLFSGCQESVCRCYPVSGKRIMFSTFL